METIKISVEVSVDLSENTQNFIRTLFAGIAVVSQAYSESSVKPTEAKTDPKPAPSAPAAPVAPAQTQSGAKPAPSAPAVQDASSASGAKSIEDVRSMLAKKVNDHRDSIKQKLTELGAPSVTKLDPAKYDEMYNYLTSL